MHCFIPSNMTKERIHMIRNLMKAEILRDQGYVPYIGAFVNEEGTHLYSYTFDSKVDMEEPISTIVVNRPGERETTIP